MKSSKAAIDLIVKEEVSSKETYEKKYRRPEWPGGSSGITIGVGYDIGYVSSEQLARDWENAIPTPMIRTLQPYCGLKGEDAKNALSNVKNKVDVPWDAAYKVFSMTDIPKYELEVIKALPNTSKLNGDCFGSLTSLTYNRGASFNTAGERYSEMRNIKAHMISGEFYRIPNEIRNMKRLWKGTAVQGLVGRREEEAKLFEKGLTTTHANSAGTTGAVIVAAGTAAATQSPEHWPWIVGGTVVAAIVIWLGVFWYKNKKVIKNV